jgi:hypothetical protein
MGLDVEGAICLKCFFRNLHSERDGIKQGRLSVGRPGDARGILMTMRCCLVFDLSLMDAANFFMLQNPVSKR